MDEPKIKPQLKLLAINYVGKCAGNKEKSAIAAGYSKNYSRAQSYKLFERADVKQYIKYLRENEDMSRDIMELHDLQEFWSAIIRDGEVLIRDRLRASELLGKSLGAFNDGW